MSVVKQAGKRATTATKNTKAGPRKTGAGFQLRGKARTEKGRCTSSLSAAHAAFPSPVPVRVPDYSHSMVPGGLDVMSRTTRLTSATSLVMRVEIRSSTS